MEFHTFDAFGKNTSVDTLIFNNDRLLKAPEGLYGLLGIPKLVFDNGASPVASPYQTVTKGLVYPKTLVFGVPSMVVHKTILYQPKNQRGSIQCLYDPQNPFVVSYRPETAAPASAFLGFLMETCESEFQKLHRITLEIKRLTTYIDFFDAYQLVEYTDILLSHTLNYTLFLQDAQAFIVHSGINSQPLDKTFTTFQDSVKLLNGILEQTRHGIMQRISYLDSGTARILTIVATIFLPSAFLVSLFSMPLQGAPLRGKKNAYWTFVVILMSVFAVLVAVFYRDFIALFTGV